MERGKGMYLWDVEGKKYLDFIGGWAVNALGHCPNSLVSVLATQAKKLINASPYFYNLSQIKLAQELVASCSLDKAFFLSSGAEANESAIKLARKFGQLKRKGAFEIITFKDGFHGRTLATMSATGKEAWKKLFEPKVPGFVHLPYNDFEKVKKAVSKKTCALMLELVQGEGGVNEAKKDFIKLLRRLCSEKNLLLIIDEIQTGLGRTGKLYAHEHYGIEADVMTLGKGIGGGFPLAAMLVKRDFDLFDSGDQGGTYTGQPLAMEMGRAVLKKVASKKFLSHVEAMEHEIKKGLEEMAKDFSIGSIRGRGLLLAFDVAHGKAQAVVARCLKRGLILNATGPNTIRLIPPLIVKRKHIKKMFDILKDCLTKTM